MRLAIILVAAFLPAMAARLTRSGVELRAAPDALAILQAAGAAQVAPAGPDRRSPEAAGSTEVTSTGTS